MFYFYKNKIVDLDEIMKSEYRYTYDNMKNFMKQPFIELEGNGVNAFFWFRYHGSEYLFKPSSSCSFWGELLSSEFAQLLGIPCASYRVASFQGQTGVLSKRITGKEETLILGGEILQGFLNKTSDSSTSWKQNLQFFKINELPLEFYQYDAEKQQRYLLNHLNNLEQVWSILEGRSDMTKDEVQEAVSFFEKMLLFDLFTMQVDRHPNNWGLIKQDKRYRAAPLFDNENSFGLGYPEISERIHQLQNEMMHAKMIGDYRKYSQLLCENRPNFTLSPENILDSSLRKKDLGVDVFRSYLEKTDLETSPVPSFFSVMTVENLEMIIAKIEEKNGITMDEELHFYVHDVFSKNLENLEKVYQAYQKGRENRDAKTIKNRI